MKKIKLLLAAMAALVTMGVQAQTWTASEVGAGDYVIYNVGSGQFLTAGNAWGTQASITTVGVSGATQVELIVNGGNYFIRTGVGGTSYGLENLADAGAVYMDQSRNKQSTWTFTQVGTDNGPVYNIISAENHGGGSGAYLTANDANTVVSDNGTSDSPYAQWKLLAAAKVPLLSLLDDYASVRTTIVGWTTSPSVTDESGATTTFNTALSAADAKANSATTTDAVNEAIADLKAAGNTFLENVIITGGIDITNAWITNPAPGVTGNPNGWTNSSNPSLQAQLYEYWNVSGATTKQTLLNLPKGAYMLSAIAYTRTGMTATLNAGTNTTNIATVASGTVNDRSQGSQWIAQGNGNGVNNLNFTLSEATASLEIGLTADNTTGDHWMCWRSFSLTYYGDPINLAKSELADAVAKAEATEGKIPTAAYTAIAAVVSEKNVSYSTPEEYESAATAINNAVSTYASAAIVADYARYKDIKAAALAIAAGISTTTTDEAVEAATTVAAIDEAIANLRAAFLAELPNVEIPVDPGYIDVTAVMVDNASVRQNTNYWTAEEIPGGVRTGNSWAVCNYEECEFYQQNFKFYQTLAMSRGTWEFGVTGFHRAGNHSTYFYAGVDKVLIPGVESSVVNTMAAAKTYFDNGNGKVALKFIIESPQDVEIGIDNQDTETDRWTIFRDFTLKYYGAVDYSVYDDQWNDAITAANAAKTAHSTVTFGAEYAALNAAIDDAPDGSSKANYLEKIGALKDATSAFTTTATIYEGYTAAHEAAQAIASSTIPTAAYATLQTAIEDNTLTSGSSDDYNNAATNLKEATATANACVAPYAAFNAMVLQVEELPNVSGYTETTSGATTTLTEAINTATNTVKAATNATAINNQIDDLKTAALTFLGGVRSDGAHPFDITFLISNPDFATDATTGWTYDNAPGYGHSAGEFYQTTFDFNQTISGLPKGNYELKVQAFQRPGWADKVYADYMAGNDNVTAEIYINEGSTSVQNICASAQNTAKLGEADGEGNWPGWPADSRLGSEGAYKYVPNSMEGASLYFAAGLYDNSVLVAVEGDLKFGFRSSTMNEAYWIIFDNFRLYYYGQSINVAMDEAQAFSALADIEGANVTMARTSKVGFNTVALPFNLTAEQVEEVFGTGAEVYTFSDTDENTIAFNTKAQQTIEANEPVLVKATAAAEQIVANNVTVKTGAAKVEGSYFDFVGNYGGQIVLSEGLWFVGNGAIYKSAGGTSMKGFRAYIQAKDGATGNVKLFIDGIETGISEINGTAVENGAIYNLAGQRVSNAQKGIYIVNGKKVIIK